VRLAPDLLLVVTPRFLRRDPNPIWITGGTVGRHWDCGAVLRDSQIGIKWRDGTPDRKGDKLPGGNHADRSLTAITERSSLHRSNNLGNRLQGCRPVRRTRAPRRVGQLRPTGSWAAALAAANHCSGFPCALPSFLSPVWHGESRREDGWASVASPSAKAEEVFAYAEQRGEIPILPLASPAQER